MNETADELDDLQALLDRSAGDRPRHLTDIAQPDWRLSAQRLSKDLRGVLVLNVATVSADGAPLLSAVDGQFLHGRWYSSTSAVAVKARHLRARPAVSAAYTPRDGYGVWTHGTAAVVAGDERARIGDYLSRVYDQPLGSMANDGVDLFRIEPRWMLGFAMSPAEQDQFDAGLPARADRLQAALTALG